MKVVLLGYMASGKTTIGKLISKELELPFIDLDTYIEEKEQKKITEIFKEKGEIYFRLKEHEYLKELLSKNEDFVLSLGGGTPCYAGNIDVITSNKTLVSVYLQASINTIIKRLKDSQENRPLVANLDKDKLAEFVAKHMFERQFFYNKASKKVLVDNKTVEETIKEITNILG